MNRIKSLAFLLTASMLQTAPNLKAQAEVFDAMVPFQFFAGDRTLPPGHYRITRRDTFLTVENRGQFVSTLILAAGADSSADGQVQLIFDHVNDLYFLHEVLAPAGSIELPVSRKEKNAINDRGRRSKATSVAAIATAPLRSGGQ